MSLTEAGNEFSEIDLRDDASINGAISGGSLEEANQISVMETDPAVLPLSEAACRPVKPQTLSLNDPIRVGESAEEIFARLESEVVQGEISGRDLVNSVLYVLVGGQFDMENAFILREGHHVRLMINLLDKCPSHLQAEILSVFIGIARRSNRNLEKCLENDLIRILLERLADASDIVADLLIELLTVLTTYSVNVKDMNAVLRYLRASNKRWPCHSVKLLVVVKQMMRKDGPDIFFTLSGHPNSGIHIPPLSRWPYQNGWSFVTWLRLDPETSGNFEEDMPYLFSFRTRSGFGHSCHFVGGCMVLTANKSKGGQALQQCIKYEFQLRKWYHVALAYSFSRWGRSEVHCYINGQRTSVVDLNWHVNTNEQYDRCFVGCSPDTNVKNSFSGQLSALYLFSETLSLQQVNSLYYLGPNYQSCFKFKNEVDIPSAYLKYLFDGKLAGSLVFAYCPKNCDRQLCLNSVNKENQVHFRQTTHAVMMDGVRVVVTHSIYTSLHSVGGVQILLPLLSQLDLPVQRSDGTTSMDYLISSILLSIFSQLLQSSPDVQLQMMQSNAFLVIGVALTAADKAHMTESVLNTLIDTAQFLMVPSATNLGLLRQLFDYVLLNPDLWINTDGKLQTRLYGYLATDFFNGAKIFNSMRRVTTVMQLLHALKFYYWVTDPLSRSGIEAKGKDGPRPSVEQITAIRTYILTLLFKIIVKDEPNAQSADEVEAILNFLTTVHEDDNLIDVLQTLIRLMAENPATLVPTFDKKKGVWVVFKLIGADGEMVRLLALKLLGFFLCRCTAKRKQDAMTPHNLYTLLVDRLLLHATYLNIRTYNVLFELLTETMTVDILDGRHKEPDTGSTFENPMIIKAIASLLYQSKENEEVLEVKRVFLTDLIHMCSSSKENRRSILQMSVWQDWLISLTSLRPKSPAEQSILKLVYQLFSTLLHHAIRLEFGGWRVWIDTMAIIHSKASFENFCLGSNKTTPRSQNAVLTSAATVEQEVYHLLQDVVRKVASQLEPDDHQVYKIDQSNDMLDSAAISQRFGANPPAGLAVPLYRIPEFRWSPAHLTLLSDLLLSIESDIAAWKNDGSRTLIDFINQSENAVFVVNSVHVISQSLDNFIVACGGLLPLLAALTSPNTDLDIVDTTSQGLPVKVAISFLIRLANLADVIVFGTACNFADLEHEKNMPNGGIMRQILRLVTTVAVRNCLVSHYRTCFDSDDLVVSVKERAIKVLVDDLASVEDVGNDFLNLRSSIQDPERVLQEVDVYRLKAAVYRDIEESRQCQFLALATVYFISVLMVSRYRDILEPPSSPSPFHNTGMAGSNWDQVDKRSDKSESIGEQPAQETAPETKEVNGEAARETTPSVDTFDDLTESIRAAAESAVQKRDKPDERLAENHDAQDKLVERKNSFNRERQALLTARLRNALDPVAPLFREIISDFQSYFQKTLLGTHGQEIMNDHKVLNTLRNPSVSVVELVMLLCSQEWQTSLQKHAGLAFIELVNEGRLLAHATRDHLVRVANEAEYILNRIRAEDVVKHAEFEALCAQAVVTCKEEENTCNLLLSAARRRNVIISRRILQKIVNILNSDYGAWGGLDKNRQYWTLDLWEDDSRRRKRLIPNPYGSSHPEATLKAIVCHGMDEKEVEEARDALAAYLSGKNIALPSLTPSSASDELVTESEVNLWNDEKETEQNQHGASCLITPCHLIAPGLALPGILSVTANEVAFDAKEDEPEFKRADPQVVRYCEHLHGRWHTGEIRAIFLRCYLLQYRALELFMASRTAVMFAFGDQSAVKQVVKQLPPVGVGVKYGIAQNRKASLMTPRQLFKLSDMPQKWQKREISNFDYLMFLNTIAGRTYNDLNQYPVFPWILSNYESKELDLKQPANFRDLSKPVGALNDSRRKCFIDRYNQWEHEKIPPFHYGTHYSTAAFTLNWMIRMEPFTTLFLNLQGGKFDHADRMFHSIGESWTRCLRDTHDVKELIPEFFYLPEILLNINGYNLGKRDDGTIMGDVKLPPWAKSAEHFISIHRQALESDLVSCQLHQWIDLIFGYKQRGPEAVRATNVFYYLTYEGVVDLSVFDDPTVKQALENQVRHFGQTPAQLLFEPHTPRQSIMTISPLMFKPIMEDLCMIMKFISNSPVVHLSANTYSQLQNPTVVSVTASLCFALNRWNNSFTSNVGSHLSPPGAESSAAQNVPVNLPLTVDPLLAAGNPATPVARRVLGDSLDPHMSVKWNNFVTTADSKYMFVCGYPDHSFRLLETDSARVRQVLYGHKAVVSCLARSECGLSSDCFLASGSRDCTVLLWHWNAKQGLLVGEHASSAESVSPKAILIGHDGEISCIHVSAEHGLVVSASVGGALLIHTTQGDLLRCLRPGGLDFRSPRILLMSRECFIVVCYDDGNLCLFTTSGRLIKHVVTDNNITCMCLSRDGEYFVVGSKEGAVFVYSVLQLTCLHQYCACDSAIKSIALAHNHRFILAGLASGAIVVYNVDFNRWHHEYSQRYTKATLN